jgi:hypothetical protein
MRDPYSIPPSGPKRFTTSIGFPQSSNDMLQLAAIALVKMRRPGTVAPVWTLDTDVGHDETGQWMRAAARVVHAFRGSPESDSIPSVTSVEAVCKVTQFSYQSRYYTTYTLDFTEGFNFEGGQNEDLVLATCAQLAFSLAEKRYIEPSQIPGFWQIQQGSWNEPHLVDPFATRLQTAFLGVVFIGLGMISPGCDPTDGIALIRSSVLPNTQQIAASGLRLDGLYTREARGVWTYLRFLPDGGLVFVDADSASSAVKVLQTARNPNIARSLYSLTGSEIRFPLWGSGWSTDIFGTIAGNGMSVYWRGWRTGRGGEGSFEFLPS